MLLFDPQTGLHAPSVADIRRQVREDWREAFRRDGAAPLDVDPETPAGQLIDSQTAAIADKNAEILYLANMFDPRTAQGVWQAALGRIYFLTPKRAQASVAQCLCSGLPGTLIPAGALARSSADQTLWAAEGDAVIPESGEIAVSFACRSGGAVAAAPGSISQIVTVTPGWDAVTNPAAAALGYEAESQAAFERRRYASVAANARGSVAALYGALSQIDGVIDLAVLENPGEETQTLNGVDVPPHSLWITVVGGDDEDIARAIYRKKDAGCGTAGNAQVRCVADDMPGSPTYVYRVQRPDALPFGFRVTLRKNPDAPGDLADRVRKALLAEFNGENDNPRVGTAQTVFAGRFCCCVVAAGAQNLVSLRMAAPVSGGLWVDSVDVPADKEPVLDESDIQIVEEA